MPSLRLASICRVEVMKGGGGLRRDALLLDRGDGDRSRPPPRAFARFAVPASFEVELVELAAVQMRQPRA